MKKKISLLMIILGLSLGFIFLKIQSADAQVEKIDFISNRDGNSEIYVMNADGTNQISLTNNSTKDFNSLWNGQGSTALNQPEAVFTNPASITINDGVANDVPGNPPANPYPSTINVSGLMGTIPTTPGSIKVTLNGFSHSFPDDVGIVLVGPTGAALLLQDGAGDNPDMNNVTYTLSDDGATILPNLTAWTAGTYKPTAYFTGDNFPSPGPGTIYGNPGPEGGGTATFASVFGGTNPNGTWSLFAADFEVGDIGVISGGWTLEVTSGGVSTAPLKICKVAGPGIPIGARFTFEVRGTTTANVPVLRTVSVPAGDAAQGGFCQFVREQDGDTLTQFTVGTPVAINETGVIDAIPGVGPGQVRTLNISSLTGFTTLPASVGNANQSTFMVPTGIVSLAANTGGNPDLEFGAANTATFVGSAAIVPVSAGTVEVGFSGFVNFCQSGTPITYGQTAFGSIDTGDCVVNSRFTDQYTFNGVAGQQVNIRFRTFQFNFSLDLLDQTGTVLAGSNPSSIFNEREITYTLTYSGTHIIRASALAQDPRYQNTTGGSYYLSIAQGSPACQYRTSYIGISFGGNGASNHSIDLTTTPGCSWTAFSNDPWITITSGSSYTGTANVTYSLAANDTGGPRRGHFTVAGLTIYVYQPSSIPCSTTLISYGQTVAGEFSTSDCTIAPSFGGYTDDYTFSGTAGDVIAVSTSPASLAPGRIRLQLFSPTGNFVNPNTQLPFQNFYTLPATGTYQIRAFADSFDLPNSTGTYSITLDSISCVYTLFSTKTTAPAAGSQNNSVNIFAAAGCPRTAVSNDSWITVTSGNSGSGNGAVSFDVAANPGTARTGTISIAGLTFTVDQLSGISPPNDISTNAQGISGVSGSLVDSNTNASAESGEPAHAGLPASHSIWYKWRAPESGLFSFTTSGSSFDTRLAVYTRPNLFFSQIAANDDNAPPFDMTSKVVFRAEQGVDYFIAVDGKNNQTGIVKLAWKQAARSFRFYAQTGNGNISPRTPVITAVRQDGIGETFTAVNISPGVFELDLPVDNFIYVVSIGGSDQWSPNSFLLSNSSVTIGTATAAAKNAPETNVTNLVTVAVTTAATISGELTGIRSLQGVSVFRGSESTSKDAPNPISPEVCAMAIGGTGNVTYTCDFIVDTEHQIKPLVDGRIFTPRDRKYLVGTPTTLPTKCADFPDNCTEFTTEAAATWNISGRVTANGNNLENVQIKLSGRKNHSFITGADGRYAFNNLPSGGSYLVEATLAGYTFAPRRIENLQRHETLDLTAQNNCSYRLSATTTTVGAVSGSGNFQIITENGCPWTVANSASWVNVSNASGSGTTGIQFTVEANYGIARSATITVGEQNFTLTQASGCTFSVVNIAGENFPAAGGAGNFTVTALDNRCGWSAETTDYCMVEVGSDTGSGTFNYRITANQGVARSAVITIAGQSFTVNQAAAAGPHRTKFDFDGDGKADLAVYRPSNGVWYMQRSRDGFQGVGFGLAEDIPVAADYDGDGLTDVAVYRPSVGTWYVLNSATGFSAVQFGMAEDKPVAADFDGDGRADIAVYRPSEGTWYRLGSQSGEVIATQFGTMEDKPVPADFDGDGRADIAVYRPSNGVWYRLNSSSGEFAAVQFGIAEDQPVPADFDGDGRTDIAVFRPSAGIWYRLNSSTGEFAAFGFGMNGDIPAAADYNGDKRADIAVFRPSTGEWYIWSCTTNPQFNVTRFGVSTDRIPQTP